MSDEEETTENGRFSCVSAKGFVLLCDVLMWFFLLYRRFQLLFCCCGFATKDVWAVLSHVASAYGILLLSLLRDISEVLPYCLTTSPIEGFFLLSILFFLRSTNEMQSSYEWECHHLRPAHIAVSVPWAAGRTKHLYRPSFEENLRGGEGNCWQLVVPWICWAECSIVWLQSVPSPGVQNESETRKFPSEESILKTFISNTGNGPTAITVNTDIVLSFIS